ncbi:hypothetical protein AB3K78_15400 [Leucobacter sp. HNU]|uniref:hypothetical protein n=1 Tax=Leucobacter sp. HNU TaxID=3236805 RepID=UPI003A7FFF17
MRSSTILAPTASINNLSTFETARTIATNDPDGPVTIDRKHGAIGDHVSIAIPAMKARIELQPNEARELARALQDLATFIEEEAERRETRVAQASLLNDTISMNVRTRVAHSSLTKAEIAARADISTSTLQRKLDPNVDAPFDVRELANLAHVFGIEVADLLDPVTGATEIRRYTEPGQPEQNGIGGGL